MTEILYRIIHDTFCAYLYTFSLVVVVVADNSLSFLGATQASVQLKLLLYVFGEWCLVYNDIAEGKGRNPTL